MKIAVVGSGIAGLGSAYLLSKNHNVTMFEKDNRFGGHSYTIPLEHLGKTYDVDCGFLVYNDRTYPNLIRLFSELRVATHKSDMSFSVRDDKRNLEWRGTNLNTVFAQRRNIFRPQFLSLLQQIVKFGAVAKKSIKHDDFGSITLRDFVSHHKFSKSFVEWYLVPIGSSIWSSNPRTFLDMPADMFIRFFERHGLLSFVNQPEWRTVTGGSKNYVQKILNEVLNRGGTVRSGLGVQKIIRREMGVEILTDKGLETFDSVVIAAHSDQALEMLADPTTEEINILGKIKYEKNSLCLHSDLKLLPRNPRARASWNYYVIDPTPDKVIVTYDISRLQCLDTRTPILATLNKSELIDPRKIFAKIEFSHPIINSDCVKAQRARKELHKDGKTFFVGAYWYNGFHEDGFNSAIDVAKELGSDW